MREICIPVPSIPEGQVAEIIFRLEGKEISFSYKLESFPWNTENDNHSDDSTLYNVVRLRESISSISSEWELIQIYTPDPDAKHIHVLFRKRN
ncbi:hypothetical protein [Williamwhitmania taraxaci]|uniref:Uncharacterized protein n=1 Tax=Williamwhitmania taraxaci TaxID=1640674 RepID=A0A1G6GQZ8_9BACT|nr:hypothetical protein [Williamwhitmania taraxaci]SDB84384.1 hypothetical protein SAMN05216323_100343 [Williamwhitmania taraxaci]